MQEGGGQVLEVENDGDHREALIHHIQLILLCWKSFLKIIQNLIALASQSSSETIFFLTLLEISVPLCCIIVQVLQKSE